eukprot:m.467697 g.467697  ORF g.467697 m.467697 type:complete len:100 (+) comp26712_c0_seq1:211-510(+)
MDRGVKVYLATGLSVQQTSPQMLNQMRLGDQTVIVCFVNHGTPQCSVEFNVPSRGHPQALGTSISAANNLITMHNSNYGTRLRPIPPWPYSSDPRCSKR